MTREGCGDVWETEGDPVQPCRLCADPMGEDRCTCGVCNDCGALTLKFSMNKGPDNRHRCPKCHARADVKIFASERPAYRPK